MGVEAVLVRTHEVPYSVERDGSLLGTGGDHADKEQCYDVSHLAVY